VILEEISISQDGYFIVPAVVLVLIVRKVSLLFRIAAGTLLGGVFALIFSNLILFV